MSELVWPWWFISLHWLESKPMCVSEINKVIFGIHYLSLKLPEPPFGRQVYWKRKKSKSAQLLHCFSELLLQGTSRDKILSYPHFYWHKPACPYFLFFRFQGTEDLIFDQVFSCKKFWELWGINFSHSVYQVLHGMLVERDFGVTNYLCLTNMLEFFLVPDWQFWKGRLLLWHCWFYYTAQTKAKSFILKYPEILPSFCSSAGAENWTAFPLKT